MKAEMTDKRLESFTEQLKELYNSLYYEGGNDLAGLAILHLSQEAHLSISDLQKLKASSPSAKWETKKHEYAHWKQFVCMPSYNSPCRLVNNPETSMHETPKISEGEVEHEVFLFSNLILLVIVMKSAFKNPLDYYAQVLLDLISAMKLNRDRDLDPQPPIYAMLSDLHDVHFFSYDGTKFRCMAQITIPQWPRMQFMKGMAQVSDLLFSLLLNGYVEILAAVEKRSAKHGNDHYGDVPRPSLDSLSKAHLKACEAQNILIKPDLASEDAWEMEARCGMNALKESVKYLFKIGSFADWDEDHLNLEISGTMDQVIKQQRKRLELTGTK